MFNELIWFVIAFTDGTECDVLYVPQSSAFSSLPPIIIEFQHSVTKSFMCRCVQYCINVYNRFKTHPILLIFCINKVESKSLANQFKPNSEKPYLLETPSNHFAECCYMMTSKSINADVNDRLYSVAKEILTHSDITEMVGMQALQTICKANLEQFAKISQHTTDNPKRAYQCSEAGRTYSEKLKRKYDQMLEVANAEESIIPMEEPEIAHAEIKHDQLSKSSLITFVEDYKTTLTGRMNWDHCWVVGQKQRLFKEFGNGASLKAIYYRRKKFDEQ
ncbi:hypothetical protein BDF20DRAFT_991420 [Mycotypha africana]|uniref:uncharacterized protein n=1 Tax=Mycotypha africana TaxID=64632 RepID=UPI002300327D|nr:uncharacterized protein BDF20DRAFT_991420 [Mycotypha africana]KAI8968496.1 hypothetical protein BDF20DRAFT_991420 [Mycotypha africana]